MPRILVDWFWPDFSRVRRRALKADPDTVARAETGPVQGKRNRWLLPSDMNAANSKKRQSQRCQTNHDHDRTEAKGQHGCQIAVNFDCVGHTCEIARGARIGKTLRCAGSRPSLDHPLAGDRACVSFARQAGAPSGEREGCQRRQCVGSMSMRSPVKAFFQYPKCFVHGNTSACSPSPSRTASSSSRSYGAVRIGFHMAFNMHWKCRSSLDPDHFFEFRARCRAAAPELPKETIQPNKCPSDASADRTALPQLPART